MHQFALKTLSYDKLMEQYLYRNEEEEAKNEFSELTARTKKKQEKPFFHNVDQAVKQLRQSQQSMRSDKKHVLPKINPKVGSEIYNILISK